MRYGTVNTRPIVGLTSVTHSWLRMNRTEFPIVWSSSMREKVTPEDVRTSSTSAMTIFAAGEVSRSNLRIVQERAYGTQD